MLSTIVLNTFFMRPTCATAWRLKSAIHPDTGSISQKQGCRENESEGSRRQNSAPTDRKHIKGTAIWTIMPNKTKPDTYPKD